MTWIDYLWVTVGNKKSAGQKYLYHFREWEKGMLPLLGGKGNALGEMTSLGLPVPPGFTLTTEACSAYFTNRSLPQRIKDQINAALQTLEKECGCSLGDPAKPLLVSVRSGAPESMPGMLETILNVGLTERTMKAVAAKTSEQTAVQCYKTLEQMFEKNAHKELPQDPMHQLFIAIEAVFASAQGEKALTYKKMKKMPLDMGTAVTIQYMVLGNCDERSCTGVLFSRNPATGKKGLYGEYIPMAQGEALVSGSVTPKTLASLRKNMPEIYQQLTQYATKLEHHYRDMQDIEFTVERGKLYILQTRNGKRTTQAAVKIAGDMVREGIISQEEGLFLVTPEQLQHMDHESLDPRQRHTVLARGLPAGPGIKTGHVCFSLDRIIKEKDNQIGTILVCRETRTDDIAAIQAADAIITARGGTMSHAAVIARSLEKCCITGCKELVISDRDISVHGKKIPEGAVLTANGYTGEVIRGKANIVTGGVSNDVKQIIALAKTYTDKKVCAHIVTPEDVACAREQGADILLYKTDHLFFKNLEDTRDVLLGNIDRLEKILACAEREYKTVFSAARDSPLYVQLLSQIDAFIPPPRLLRLQEDMDKLAGKASENKFTVGAKVIGNRPGHWSYGVTGVVTSVILLGCDCCSSKYVVKYPKEELWVPQRDLILSPDELKKKQQKNPLSWEKINKDKVLSAIHAAQKKQMQALMPQYKNIIIISKRDTLDIEVCKPGHIYATRLALAQQSISDLHDK